MEQIVENIDLKVLQVGESSRSELFIVILQEIGDKHRCLPLPTGREQSRRIDQLMRRVSRRKQYTTDHLVETCQKFGIIIEEVLFYEVSVGSIWAYVFMEQDGHRHRIRMKGDEAVILALTAKCPLRITGQLMAEQRSLSSRKGHVSIHINMLADTLITEALKKAVENQEYERAAQLRDELKRRKR